jgi:alkylation response protein AidB-like acyl-CoA dehydrogenase
MSYQAPLADFRFLLEHVLDLEELLGPSSENALDTGTVTTVLEEGARFAEERLAPTNRDGDKEGARLTSQGVTAPASYKAVYADFVAGGWNGLTFPTEHDGLGLPETVGAVLQEMWQSANMSFSLCPLLTQGAAELLLRFGTPEQLALYAKPMVSGRWTGTMNLTEPQAGSDLSATRALAEPKGAPGRYLLRGQKIYITWGEHDLADNIVHMVLARTPNAPEGTHGLSLFLVPRRLPKEDGSPGALNDVRAVSIEHKLGIHGSPTCVLSYGDNGGAEAWLVGEPHQGLAAMFLMMNRARLSVGQQGVAVSEAAYQAALRYARERVQGSDPRDGKTKVTIVHHPDVRRMLWIMKSQIDAMRLLALDAFRSLDLAARDPAGEQDRHERRVALLTPIVKAWCTEVAQEIVSLALQVHGGMGYVEETGVAQYVRDARILTIYEGTTGIQALDFVGRKILRDRGAGIAELGAEIAHVFDAAPRELAERLPVCRAALKDWQETVKGFLEAVPKDPLLGSSVATPLLMATGTLLGAAMHVRSSARAVARGERSPIPAVRRLASAAFYVDHILPRATAYLAAARSGVGVLGKDDDLLG